MKITDLRIKRCMRDEDAAAWARALAAPEWWADAVVLKDEPGSSWVRRATISGREVVVKGRYLNRSSRRVKSMLGFGHGDKHWRGAALLASKKIATARPVVLAVASVDGTLCELLVLEYLPGESLLDLMRRASTGELPVRTQHRIAAAVADQVIELGWLLNRDHKPSNLIVSVQEEQIRIAIIDCVGVKFRQVLRTERMFANLVIEPIGCGIRPRRTLLMRGAVTYEKICKAEPDNQAIGDSDFPHAKQLWREVERIIRRHGDPRPTVHPFARTQSPGAEPAEPASRS